MAKVGQKFGLPIVDRVQFVPKGLVFAILPFSGPVSGRQLLAEVSDEIRFAAFQLKII